MKRLWLISCILLVVLGNGQAQETKRPVYYFNPSWSPDGKNILFESTRDGKFAIYTVRIDGTGLRKLTSGEANDEQPRWSPDGKQIVFISDRDGHLQLYLMNKDGSHQRRLTSSDNLDYLPDFSPKGDLVVFMSRAETASVVHDLYVIRTDGSGRTRLTGESANEMSPRWSPNGKQILFEQTAVIKKYYREMTKEDMAKMRASQEIFVMNADGSNPINLTNNQTHDWHPAWSKDGKTIYFLSERDGAPNIYAMNADGSKVRKVADGAVVKEPNLARDEKYFVYTKEVKGTWGIYIYHIASRQERLLIGR